MNDIEKRIELEVDAAINLMEATLTFADVVKERSLIVARLVQLYHQLLSEERQRLIGVVEGMKMEYKDEAWNKLCSLSKNDVGLDEGAMTLWNAALEALLATLNKEKD